HDVEKQGVKLVEIRNFQKESWVHDLEIEIKNISKKPIYYIEIFLKLPEVQYPPRFVFELEYGNSKLINNDRLAGPEDVPIYQDEKFIFKIPKTQAQGFERMASKYNFPAITKMIFDL